MSLKLLSLIWHNCNQRHNLDINFNSVLLNLLTARNDALTKIRKFVCEVKTSDE